MFKIILLSLLLSPQLLISQKDFSIQFEGGPNYYFNNLVIFSENLDPINYSAYTKLMWNTRYRLSFGIEAGYVRLYRLNDFTIGVNSQINMTSIPVHAAVEMRFSKNLFAAFSFGPSFIRNDLISKKGEQSTHTFSTADISFGLGYRHTFRNQLFIGIESKFYYSSKLEDRNIALPVFVGLNF
jgi:hypothetical protein